MAPTGKYYNNGIINIRVNEGDPIPEGFIPGMKKRSEDQKREILEKRKKTNLEKFGVEFPLQSSEVKEEMKKHSLEKWGTEHPMQSQEMKDKYKEIFLEKYGVEYITQSSEIQEKIKQTNLEKLGVERPAQSKEVRDKMKQTCLDRYGVENAFQSEEKKDKSKQTMKEHYGVEHALQSKELRDKAVKTIQERYGVPNAMQSQEVRDKGIQTNLERYGVENPFQSEEVKAKIKETSLAKYGTEYPNQSEEVKNKIVESSREHWGTDNPMQSEEVKKILEESILRKYGARSVYQLEEVREKSRKTMLERYGVEHALLSEKLMDKLRNTNLEKYGVPYACMRDEARAYTNDSSYNRGFAEFLESRGISYEREFHISYYSYDFKVGNVLVEIDPMPFHNALWSPFNKDKGVDPDYHQKKSQTAFGSGYSCIHIFDWDDKDKVIELLKKREKVYARDTKVFGLESKECNEYLKEYHLQGTCLGQSIRLALRDSYGEIVSVMTFGKPRYNKNYQWELLRLCSHKYVIGGAEKLFKYFIENYNPESIISYCDRAKFSGKVYKSLGFKLLSTSKPSKHWYSPDKSERMQHITDNFLRQRGYDQIFGASFGKGTSNEELIINRGYVLIYDCGQDTYIWKR